MQLNLDFRSRPNADLGKMVPLSISCPSTLKAMIEMLANTSSKTVSELCYRWLIEGFTKELGEHFLIQPHMNETLRSILTKKI